MMVSHGGLVGCCSAGGWGQTWKITGGIGQVTREINLELVELY